MHDFTSLNVWEVGRLLPMLKATGLVGAWGDGPAPGHLQARGLPLLWKALHLPGDLLFPP